MQIEITRPKDRYIWCVKFSQTHFREGCNDTLEEVFSSLGDAIKQETDFERRVPAGR